MSQKKRRILRWLVTSIITIIASTLILVIRADYTTRGYSDALFVPGIVLLFIFFLKLVKNAGAFDMVSYTIGRLIHSLRHKEVENVQKPSDYLEDKRLERKQKTNYYWPEVVIAVIFIASGTILAFIN